MYTQKFFNTEYFGKNKFEEFSAIAKKFLQDFDLPDALKICYENKDVEKAKDIINNNYKDYIIFGTGGSSLAGQVIKEFFDVRHIHFFDNIDPQTFKITGFDPFSTLLIIISKSGETLETLSQVAALPENWPTENIVIVTEEKLSRLNTLAHKFNIKLLPHSKTIGGRFSVFSFTGVIPCIIGGLDPMKLRLGGIEVIENRLNDVAHGAALLALSIIKKLPIMPLITYNDKCRNLMDWLVQLFAESLGKDEHGITPMPVYGTVYQHSLLQLFLDGPKDKFFNIFHSSYDFNIISTKNQFSMVKPDTLNQVYKEECSSALSVVTQTKLPTREFIINSASEHALGGIFAHFILETIACAHLVNINPMDQPGVEKIKVILKKLLR